jgi:regulator of ribonuclease activity A
MGLTADICDSHGTKAQTPDVALRHFGAKREAHGPALLIRLAGRDSLLSQTLATPGEGRMIVVTVDSSTDTAVFGAGMAAALAANGWAGIVIDGAVRDVSDIAEQQICVAAKRAWPRISRDGEAGALVDEMRFADLTIRSGDYVYCDGDGVVILAA